MSLGSAHQRLTPARIKRAAPSRAHEVWIPDDDGVRGRGRLLLRVTTGGTKLFYYRQPRRKQGGGAVVPIGPYSHVARPGYFTLSQARFEAGRLYAEFELGCLATHAPRTAPQPQVRNVRPQPRHSSVAAGAASDKTPVRAVQLEAPAAAEGDPTRTVGALCEAYAQNLDDRKKAESAADVRGYIRRELTPNDLANRPVTAVDGKEIGSFLRHVFKTKTGYTAERMRQLLHAAFALACETKIDPSQAEGKDWGISQNPVASIASLSEYRKARSRHLSQRELAALLKRLAIEGDQTPAEIRAIRASLLLGGQRYEQLLRLKIEQVDLPEHRLLLLDPKGRRSTPREHWLPTLPKLEQELQWLTDRARDIGSDMVFASQKRGKVLRASTVSRRLFAISREMLEAGEVKEPFQLCDLRRTVETYLASKSVSKDLRAQLQSHGIGGVQDRHYDWHDYLQQKRELLQMWTHDLDELCGGTF